MSFCWLMNRNRAPSVISTLIAMSELEHLLREIQECIQEGVRGLVVADADVVLLADEQEQGTERHQHAHRHERDRTPAPGDSRMYTGRRPRSCSRRRRCRSAG